MRGATLSLPPSPRRCRRGGRTRIPSVSVDDDRRVLHRRTEARIHVLAEGDRLDGRALGARGLRGGGSSSSSRPDTPCYRPTRAFITGIVGTAMAGMPTPPDATTRPPPPPLLPLDADAPPATEAGGPGDMRPPRSAATLLLALADATPAAACEATAGDVRPPPGAGMPMGGSPCEAGWL